MWSAVVAGMRRHRRRVLGGAVLGVLAWTGLALLAPGPDRDLMVMFFSLLVAVLAVLSAVVNSRPGPAAFLVDTRTPAFRALPNDGQLLSAVIVVSLAAVTIVGGLSRYHDTAGELAYWVPVSILTVITALLVVLAWLAPGLQLRPDGLVDATGLGTRTVPWEALTPAGLPVPSPNATRLRLTFAHPELVRRKGLVLGSAVATTGVNPVLLTHAIGYYLVNPDRRRLIGTQAGYDELVRALAGLAQRA
jgi:hypothetical protein